MRCFEWMFRCDSAEVDAKCVYFSACKRPSAHAICVLCGFNSYACVSLQHQLAGGNLSVLMFQVVERAQKEDLDKPLTYSVAFIRNRQGRVITDVCADFLPCTCDLCQAPTPVAKHLKMNI